MADDYEVEIISSYQLFDKPAFDIDPRVEVRYLITKYKPNREAWKSSIKHLRPISFVKESFNSVMTLALRRSTMIRAIENCHSDIIISTRDLFNTWLGTYGRKSCYKIGWEHNHYHGDMSYADKVTQSAKNLDALVLVSDSLRKFYKKQPAIIIERDSYYLDYLVKFKDGTEDWIEEKYLRKPYARKYQKDLRK